MRRRSRVRGYSRSTVQLLTARSIAATSTRPGVWPIGVEPAGPTGLGLVGVDGQAVVGAAARVGDVVGAAAQRTAAPAVDEVEHERGVDPDRRVQRRGRLPRPVAHAGHEGLGPVGAMERNGMPLQVTT